MYGDNDYHCIVDENFTRHVILVKSVIFFSVSLNVGYIFAMISLFYKFRVVFTEIENYPTFSQIVTKVFTL